MARSALMLILMMGAPVAFAQDEGEAAEEGREIKYKERTEIDFDGVDVAGELVKPSQALITAKRRASFNPLISLRTDFNLEMRSSVEEIK